MNSCASTECLILIFVQLDQRHHVAHEADHVRAIKHLIGGYWRARIILTTKSEFFMRRVVAILLVVAVTATIRAADGDIEIIKAELQQLKKRIAALEEENAKFKRQATFERVVVKKELIVSDTGGPWEVGYETQQIPRGIYARSL